MKKLKLGMVGGGQGAFIGAVHRIAARIDDQWELVAGALASSPGKARASATEIGLQRSYDDYQQMAEREAALPPDTRIDAVAIVTPNHMHFPVAQCFWQHGFHVISDKPMCLNVSEAEKLARLIRQKPQQIYVLTHNYSGYPMIRHARNLVRSGILGKLRFVELKYIQGWLTRNSRTKQAAWRGQPELAGLGGSLGDIATHACHLCHFVTGLSILELSAELHTFTNQRILDDNAQILLRFAGGARGQLWSSQIAIGHENGLQIAIYGERGSLQWHQEQPNHLYHCNADGIQQRYTRGGVDTETAPATIRVPAGHPEGYLEGFAQIYLDAAACIRARKAGQAAPPEAELLPEVRDGLAGMHFIQAAWDSNQQNGAWVTMKETQNSCA